MGGKSCCRCLQTQQQHGNGRWFLEREREMLEVFDVGPCEDGHQMGFLIGQRFSDIIRSRVATDLILQHQLLPFARSLQSQPLIQALSHANRERFPRYWEEMVGIAEGSGVSFLHILLLNFRKEILPFIPKTEASSTAEIDAGDCSDVLVVHESIAVAAHNEDANVALVGHVYLIRATLADGLGFTAYTYAGELPSCAFGFNCHGLVRSYPFIRLLHSIRCRRRRKRSKPDALAGTSFREICLKPPASMMPSSYNLVDVHSRRIWNVETASMNRVSVKDIGSMPFFHANMYLHLQVKQANDHNSISRQRRAGQLPKDTKPEILSLLGDTSDEKYPIYMQGPTLHTLCTAVIDLDQRTLSIIEGNPKKDEISHLFSIS